MAGFGDFLNLGELVQNFLGDFRRLHLACDEEIVALCDFRGEIGLLQ